MIEASDLVKYYGNHQALKGISFTVGRGEVLGFLGPNGAGKSTVLKILSCFIPPSSGEAKVAGIDVTQDPLQVRQRIGYLPEKVPLYRDITVKSFLEFSGGVKGLGPSQLGPKVQEVIELCGIAQVATKHIRKLSKGFCQRVGIAQALIGDPEVLILDEPTVGLDPRQIVEIRQIIKNQSGKRTVILSTHILPEVTAICDTVMIIDNGRIVARDTPENLARKVRAAPQVRLRIRGPSHEVLAGIASLGSPTTMEQTVSTADQVHDYVVDLSAREDLRGSLARAVAERWTLLEMRPLDVTLEEIFMKLVREEEAVAG
jgi:ABC-2 type transport system ATP-binding protein